uniref:(northern house mosquito) hypothetical protein n=1 Tax=Culex pipiens TaxID=7175 RepID=A0A8D8FQ44_CULPI
MTTEKVAWERNALTKIFFLQHSAFVFPSHSASSSSTFFSKARLTARFGFVCLGGLLSSFVRPSVRSTEGPRNRARVAERCLEWNLSPLPVSSRCCPLQRRRRRSCLTETLVALRP